MSERFYRVRSWYSRGQAEHRSTIAYMLHACQQSAIDTDAFRGILVKITRLYC